MAQGQIINIRIHIATWHWGRFELRLCPLSDPSLVTENKVYMLPSILGTSLSFTVDPKPDLD